MTGCIYSDFLKLILLRNLVTQMTTHMRPPDIFYKYYYTNVFNLTKSLTNVTASAATNAICVAIERTHKFPP